MAFGGQLQQRRSRVFAAVMQVGDSFARQTGAQRAHNGLLRHAQHRSLAAVHQQHDARRAGDAAVVHIDHVAGFLENGAHRLGHGAAAVGVGAVDFGHDGREHRRAWRHFHHFHIGAMAQANFLQPGPDPGGDGMALVAALVLVHQVHLDVADFAAGAQVILAHQAVEVDRGCRAGIRLVVGHFRYAGQVGAEFMQHGGSFLDWRAGRHIDNDLELGLVVEGQHFEQHQPGGRQHQGKRNQPGNAKSQQAPIAPAALVVEQRLKNALEQRCQLARHAGGFACGGVVAVAFLHPQPGQPGRDDKRNRQRQQHAHAGIDGDGAHVRPHQAADESHRQQCSDHRERGQDGRAADFIDGARNDLGQRLAGKKLLMAVDVFNHHDGIVHQNTDGKDQREQRHAVQREAPGPGGKQRHGQRQNHRRADDRRFTAAQREKYQRHHRGRGEQQFLDQLLRLVVGAGAVVARLGDLHRIGNHGIAQLRDPRHDGVGHVDGILARFLGHGHGHGRVLATATPGGQAMPDIAAGRQRAVAHGRHIFQEYWPAFAHADHQVGDLAGLRQEGAGFDGHALVAGQQFAHRHAHIRRLQRLAHLLHRHARARHAPRVQFDQHGAAGAAQGLHFARAGNALDVGLDAVRHALQVIGAGRCILAVERQRDNGHVVDAFGLDDRLHHAQAFRQPVGVVLDGVVQPHQRLGARHAHLELHRQHRHAGTRHRHHMLHAGNLRQHLFARCGHHLLDIAHRGARKRHQHIGHGDVNLRLFLPRRDQHRKNAQQQRDERQQRGDLCALEEGGDAA